MFDSRMPPDQSFGWLRQARSGLLELADCPSASVDFAVQRIAGVGTKTRVQVSGLEPSIVLMSVSTQKRIPRPVAEFLSSLIAIDSIPLSPLT